MSVHNPHKPFILLDTRSLRQERMAVVDAIQECMTLAEFAEPLRLRDFGRYRDPCWRDDDGDLRPHLSVDWYVRHAWNLAKEKLSGSRLLETLAKEPWRREELLGDHYDVWLVDHALYDDVNLDEDAVAVGMSRAAVGLVLSVRPFDEVRLPTYSLLKTAALHELGHLFGVPGIQRPDVAFAAEVHCTGRCVMRHADATAEPWLVLTRDRLAHGPYCEGCLAELRSHFQTSPQTNDGTP